MAQTIADKVADTLERGYPLRFCRKCRHRDVKDFDGHVCKAQRQQVVNLVTGETEETGPLRRCADMRLPNSPCGPAGVLYEAKVSWWAKWLGKERSSECVSS